MKNIKNVEIKKLLIKKNFEGVILFIENAYTEIEKTSEILNILGVCKLQKKHSNSFDLISAIEDFRNCYLKEKKTKQGIEGLINFIVCSNKIRQYEDSIRYFKETEKSFGYIQKLFNLMVDVYKNLSNVKDSIYCLKKIIENENIKNCNSAFQRYIYFNNFINHWSQKDFFENTIKIEQTLPQFLEQKKINTIKNKKIKLAFFSSDIRKNHSVTGFLKTVVSNVDKDKFELIFFSNCKIEKEDMTTEDFKIYFDKWININNLNDNEAINTIKKDKIDIAIDLMGPTSSNRMGLFKNRIAPIQILWLGYNNTSGLTEMDYFIADTHLIEKKEVKFYSEKILFLPSIWNCHSGFSTPRKEIPSPLIKNKYITFGSFNNFNKISDEVIDVWSKILKKTKNSRLILKSSRVFSHSSLMEKFKKNKVSDLITIMDTKDNFKDHMEKYKKIDIALDTFPYNGVTTSFEAIWMGVPLLTLNGFNANSRTGVSINKNINMNYFIAKNIDEYILKAIELSNNFKKVNEARKYLFNNTLESNLFNTKKFSKEFFETLVNINPNYTA